MQKNLENDILIELFCYWIKKGQVPDELSREFIDDGKGNDELVIRFRNFNGESMNFPYSEEKYEILMQLFNDYWNSLRLSNSQRVYLN